MCEPTQDHLTIYLPTAAGKGFRVYWSPEDQEWVGTCEAYPSLSWLSNTADGALKGIISLQRATALEMLAEEAGE